ncbi:MAG TPA: protein kinase [Longimicrobiales bacterium]|nr:protein kinase [Longimicrobiales bacterium]
MTPRLLLVDDDDAIRASLASALGDGDLEVVQAASGEDAVHLLETAAPPELILTDIRMRGVGGMELLRAARELVPGAPVVIMTAYHDVGTAVEAMREGAADFLCKPFDLATVRDVVERLLPGVGEGRAADVRQDRADTALGPDAAQSGTSPTDARPLLGARYELEEEVGRGAMARVFRAFDVRHQRPVAVKVLRREVAASIGRERFLQEIRITAGLHHPHILTLIDSGEWEGSPFFVTPFVDGPSLRETLDRRVPLPVSWACTVLHDVADALAAAHSVGVIHRDVKPANVLMGGSHAWVADFGVARAVRDASGVRDTLVGSVIGTPAYMAPEQAAGGEQVDHRADLYALGVVACELLTGRLPFSGETSRAILTAHICAAPTPPSRWRPDLPPELEAAVMCCLAKEPDERPRTAREVAATFRSFSRRSEP